MMALSQDPRFEIVAINYKDKPENALGFLNDLGNPFDAVGTDEAGRSTIDWGVYGVPETFLVGPDGTILWKQTGPLTREGVEGGLMPALAKIAPPKSVEAVMDLEQVLCRVSEVQPARREVPSRLAVLAGLADGP